MLESEILLNNGRSVLLSHPKTLNTSKGVLFLHGFASDRNEVGDLYKQLTETFTKNGFTCLRFNFNGFIDSKETIIEPTIKTMHNAALNAYQHLANIVKLKRISVVGFSLGSALAASLLQYRNIDFESTVLISPCADLRKDFMCFLGKENYNRLKSASREITIDIGWREIKLPKNFYHSLLDIEPLKYVSNSNTALLTLAGAEDFSCKNAIRYGDKFKFRAVKNIEIKGADHIFNALCPSKSCIDRISTYTFDWIMQYG